jgi:hypothetical protein
MNRRHLVLGTAALAGSALLWRFEGRWPRYADPIAARLAGLLTHADSARAIGREYLLATPTEATTTRLMTLVVAAALPRGIRGVTDTQLRAYLLARIRDDFAQERVVTVAGWVLSRTEARLYALTALDRAGRS